MHINFLVCAFVGKLNVVMSLVDRKIMDMTGVFSVKIINTVDGFPLFLTSWIHNLYRYCCDRYDVLIVLFYTFLSFSHLKSLFYFVWLSLPFFGPFLYLFFLFFKYHTNKCTYIVFSKLKFTLKHLKLSYMFRSYVHPQGEYFVPC